MISGLFKKCAGAIAALVLTGCATTNITMAVNDQCLVTATDDEGNAVMAPAVDQDCWNAKRKYHEGALNREVVAAEQKGDVALQAANDQVEAVRQQEILKTYGTAAQLALQSGAVSLDRYEAVLHPLILKVGGDSKSKAIIEQGYGIDVDRLKEVYKAHFDFATKKCELMATPGVQAVAFKLEGYPEVFHVDHKDGKPYGPCVKDEAPVPAQP